MSISFTGGFYIIDDIKHWNTKEKFSASNCHNASWQLVTENLLRFKVSPRKKSITTFVISIHNKRLFLGAYDDDRILLRHTMRDALGRNHPMLVISTEEEKPSFHILCCMLIHIHTSITSTTTFERQRQQSAVGIKARPTFHSRN